MPSRGRLAQLVERLPYKQEVTGSSPVPPTHEPAGNRPVSHSAPLPWLGAELALGPFRAFSHKPGGFPGEMDDGGELRVVR
jgi:hypothetical protein